MRKINYANVLFSLIAGLLWSGYAAAETIMSSIRYSFSSNSKLNDPDGFNIKCSYHWDDTLVGTISSFTNLQSVYKYNISNINWLTKSSRVLFI